LFFLKKAEDNGCKRNSFCGKTFTVASVKQVELSVYFLLFSEFIFESSPGASPDQQIASCKPKYAISHFLSKKQTGTGSAARGTETYVPFQLIDRLTNKDIFFPLSFSFTHGVS
jgi:hypothetical protein